MNQIAKTRFASGTSVRRVSYYYQIASLEICATDEPLSSRLVLNLKSIEIPNTITCLYSVRARLISSCQ